MQSVIKDRVTIISGDRDRCFDFLRELSRSEGSVHCFPEDEVDPSLSAMDNIIMMTSSPNKGNILRAVRSAGLPVNQRAGELSLSDRRKIVLLRSLFAEYEILLMDNPLAQIEDHLDYLKELASSLTENRTVVIYSNMDMGINFPDYLVL